MALTVGAVFFATFLVVLGRGGEAQRGPERPREAQRGPERPRSSEIPRGLVPSTEKSDDPFTGRYSFDGGRGVFCYFLVVRRGPDGYRDPFYS